MPTWTVGDTARLAHVTIRTLHHYDAIGLLSPRASTAAGYRLYDEADLQRLLLIRLYRQLGLGLEPIRRILDEPGFDRIVALQAHRERLLDALTHTQTQVETIDRILNGATMTAEQLFTGFNPDADEAKARWGHTEAFEQSAKRTKGYGPDDWKRIKEEMASIEADFAAALRRGVPAADIPAMDLAEVARLHIDRWYYPCSLAMHVNLGDMYVADPRFTQHYDAQEPGLAAYVAAAIRANAARG